MVGFKEFFTLLKEAAAGFGEDNAARLAAALSYYALFSLAPMIVLVVFILGQVLDPQTVRGQIIGQIQRYTGSEQIADFIRGIVEARASFGDNLLATLITLVTLFIGATGLFGQLQDSLNKVWGVETASGGGIFGMLKGRLTSFLMIMVLGLLLVLSLLASTVLTALTQFAGSFLSESAWLVSISDLLLSGILFTLVFAVIFKVLPDVKIDWKDVWLGAGFTAVLFVVGKELIALYMGSRALGDVYGAASSIIALLLWVYYSAQIFFFGAEFTQVYARRHGSRIVPEAEALSISSREDAGGRKVMERGKEKQAYLLGGDPGWRSNQPVEPVTVIPDSRPLATMTAVIGVLIGFLGGWVFKMKRK